MGIIRPKAPDREAFESLFLTRSAEVIEFRSKWATAYEGAKTDAERHRLENGLISSLPTLYAEVDRVLDNYSLWRIRNAG